MTNDNHQPNRAERRHPSEAPTPQGNAHDIHIHLQTSDRGPNIKISSFAANVLLQLANSVPVAGSTMKMQLSLAQLELEEGLKNPLPREAPVESAPIAPSA